MATKMQWNKIKIVKIKYFCFRSTIINPILNKYDLLK